MIVEVVKPDHQLYDKFNTLLKKGNVIVLYYANWCGHCQNMKPEWEAFKSKCKKDPKYKHLHVAEVESEFIDNTKAVNEVQGFPTIKFYKKNTTGSEVAPEVIDFQEDRNVNNFLNFTEKNTVKDNKDVEVVEQKVNNNSMNMKNMNDNMKNNVNNMKNNKNTKSKKKKGKKGARKTSKKSKSKNNNNSVKTKKAKLPKRNRTKKETTALRDLVFGKK